MDRVYSIDIRFKMLYYWLGNASEDPTDIAPENVVEEFSPHDEVDDDSFGEFIVLD